MPFNQQASSSIWDTDEIQGGPFDPAMNYGSNPYGPIMPPQVPHTYEGDPRYNGIPGGTPPPEADDPAQQNQGPWWQRFFGNKGGNSGIVGTTQDRWTDYTPGQYDAGWNAANGGRDYGDPMYPSGGAGSSGGFYGAGSRGPGGPGGGAIPDQRGGGLDDYDVTGSPTGGGSGGDDMGGGGGYELPTGGIQGDLDYYEQNPFNVYDYGAGDVYEDFASGAETPNERLARTGWNQFASGQMTPREADVYGRYSELSRGPNRDDQALRDAFRRYGLSTGPYEAGAAGGFGAAMSGTLDPRNADLFNRTRDFGATPGWDEGIQREQLRGMVEHGGYDEATRNALEQEGMRTAAASFGGAQDRIARIAGVTGNTAGQYGAEVALGSAMAGTAGQQARQNIIAEAAEKARQKELGLSGLSRLQDQVNQRQQSSLGQQADLLREQNALRLSGASGLAHLQGLTDARRQFGLSGEAGRADQAFAQRMGALGRLDNTNAALRGYRAAGITGQTNANNALRGYRAIGAQGQAGLGRDMYGRQTGVLDRRMQMYDEARRRQLAQQQLMAQLGTHVREDYQSGDGTGGTGGVNAGGNIG